MTCTCIDLDAPSCPVHRVCPSCNGDGIVDLADGPIRREARRLFAEFTSAYDSSKPDAEPGYEFLLFVWEHLDRLLSAEAGDTDA